MGNNYQTTRYKLTALYFGIILIILALFSVIVIAGQLQLLDRFDHVSTNASENNPYTFVIPDTNSQYIIDLNNRIQNRINEIKTAMLLTVLLLDASIASLSLIGSYYLAGATLKPILDTLERQKQFVGDASHELKTPLTVIKTEAEVLLHIKKPKLTELQEFVETANSEVDRLTSLVNQLLYIAKSDHQVTKTEPVQIDLNHLITESLRRLQSIAMKQEVVLTYHQLKKSVLITADQSQLQQLLEILLDNAIKYNHPNGRIIVKLNSVGQPIITITDDGIGISEADLPKVFDRFYRSAKSRSDKGFGLGLAIAKQICDLNNIEIQIESKLGKGTSVSLKFKPNQI